LEAARWERAASNFFVARAIMLNRKIAIHSEHIAAAANK
jgi:hypothetical protein